MQFIITHSRETYQPTCVMRWNRFFLVHSSNGNILLPLPTIFLISKIGNDLSSDQLTHIFIIEGSLEVKLPTIWTDEQQRWEESERRKSQRKEDPGARKVGKSRNTAFFQWFVALEGRKVGSLKRRVRSQLARWEAQLWREARFQVKMYKTIELRSTFRGCDVEKVHAVVARSTFPSQNVQNTLGPDHFLEVEMSKKCTPLWREAHFEFKTHKTHHVRTTFGSCDSCDVEKVHAVEREAHFEVKMYKALQLRTAFGSCDVEKVHAVVARSTFRSQKCKKLMGLEHFWTFRCRFEWQAQGIVRAKFIRDVRRSGRWFPEKGCIWSIWSVGLLRWFSMTGAALRMTWPHFFVTGAVLYTYVVEKSQNALVRGRQRCTQLSMFEGGLAELLRFWCCKLSNFQEVDR